MTTTNENLIIDMCLQGCCSSFEKLVHAYQSHVIALSVNILGNYDEALDSTQDTFVQAYVNLNRFDRERKFKSWLLSIAAKRCLDSLRKKKSIRNYFIKQTKEFHPHSHDSYRHFKPVEESEIFFPLLKKMKDNERVAVLLKVNENYSAKEIADVLNCSESTARVHLFNGKQKLKKALVAGGGTFNRSITREVSK